MKRNFTNLFKGNKTMDDNFDDGWAVLQRSTPINKSGISKERPRSFTGSERLCFIITKNQTNSWADDLYQYGRLDDFRRVFH